MIDLSMADSSIFRRRVVPILADFSQDVMLLNGTREAWPGPWAVRRTGLDWTGGFWKGFIWLGLPTLSMLQAETRQSEAAEQKTSTACQIVFGSTVNTQSAHGGSRKPQQNLGEQIPRVFRYRYST